MKKNKLYIVIFLLFLTGSILSIKAKSIPYDSLSREFDKTYLLYGNRSKEIIDELYSIAQQDTDSLPLIYDCLHKEALLSFEQGIMNPAVQERLKHHLENENLSPYEKALLECSLGMYLSATGDYSAAFSVTLQSLTSFRELNDSTFIAKDLHLLGTICSQINLTDMSNEYYKEALQYCLPNSPEYLRIKNNIARLSLFLGNEQTAIDSLSSMIPVAQSASDLGMQAIIYTNIGACYLRTEDYDKALQYWERADEILKESDNPRLNAILNQYFGVYHVFVTHNYRKALDYFRITKQIAEDNHNLVQASAAYNIMSQTFEKNHQLDSAYFYLKKFQELSLQLVPNPKAIEAYRSYVSTFLEASENTLTIARQEIELKSRHNMVIIMVLISVILIGAIFLLLFIQKKRKKERENQLITEQFKHEQVIQQIEKKRQEDLIEAQTREITSYSLLLSNKNEIFNQILDLNTRLSNDTQNFKEVSTKIKEIIQNNLNVDKEWETFKMHFEKVHPSFFNKLKVQFPNLTENNLRICAYFRIGMSTKQIAQILNISPGSVFLHRHRLKKKLGLEEENDLDDFIRGI